VGVRLARGFYDAPERRMKEGGDRKDEEEFSKAVAETF